MNTSASTKAVIHLAAAVMLLLGLDAYLNREIRKLRSEAGGTERSIVTEVADVRSAEVRAEDAQQQTEAVLEADLAAAPAQVATAALSAMIEAQRRAGFLARRMAQARRMQTEWADAELASIRASAEATGEEARRLATDLRTARSAALSGGARSDLTRVETELSALHSDVDADSAQLAAMRARGRRQTFAFRAGKAAGRAEAGGLEIRLRKIDAKRQRYVLEVTTADGRTERHEGAINEPIRFLSYELVVNEIAGDEVGGEIARNYSSGNAETRNLPGR